MDQEINTILYQFIRSIHYDSVITDVPEVSTDRKVSHIQSIASWQAYLLGLPARISSEI